MLLEIRRYEILSGRRDEFAEWFDTEVLPEMEKAGMRIIGQFVSLDDPDAFFYLRAFSDEKERTVQIERLYGGEKWQNELVGYARELETSFDVETVTPTARSQLH